MVRLTKLYRRGQVGQQILLGFRRACKMTFKLQMLRYTVPE